MTNTCADVGYVARLARLGPADEEIDSLTSEVDHMLDPMRSLQQLDTPAIPPTAKVIPLHNIMREDVARTSWLIEGILNNAPTIRDGQFLVPRVLE